MAKISLKSIANEFGVSVATVSLVLSGAAENGRVGRELSKNILLRAKELNYVPNSIAKNLRMGNSKTIGLIVADISNVFFGKLAFETQEIAERRGYTVIIGNTNESIEKMQSMVDMLQGRRVDGFIATPTAGSEVIVRHIIKENIPIVLVDRYFPDLSVNSVTINNKQVSYNAVNSLIESGCRRIGIIVYTTDRQAHMKDRLDGYVQAVTEASIFDISLIMMVGYENVENDVANAIDELINKGIDGVFFATNTISLLGLKTLFLQRDKNIEQIKYMCFDENDAFYILPFKVPFVKQPIREIAEKSIDLLINQIENKTKCCEHCVISAELSL